jgi:Tfp pilus assembly protein PilF
MGLLLLTGCATDGSRGPAAVEKAQVMTEGPSVTRLTDGREGFIISEVSSLNEDSRENFAHAVDLLNNQAYEDAIDLLKQVIDQSPGVTAPYIDIAVAYDQIGKSDEAEANIKIALELVPNHPVASNEYGRLCRKSGRFDEARVIYEKALGSFPEYYPLHRNLGILCDLYLNDPVSALEHYRIYSQAMPDDRQVQLWIADLSARTGSN